MFKKFVSRALLSVVMDKQARRKLEAARDAKAEKAQKNPEKPGKHVKNASAGKSVSKKARPKPPPDELLDDLPETLIQRAIDEAKSESSGAPQPKREMTTERERLIAEAMAVHKQQSKLLDELPKEQREKLQVMALHAFGDEAVRQAARKVRKKD